MANVIAPVYTQHEEPDETGQQTERKLRFPIPSVPYSSRAQLISATTRSQCRAKSYSSAARSSLSNVVTWQLPESRSSNGSYGWPVARCGYMTRSCSLSSPIPTRRSPPRRAQKRLRRPPTGFCNSNSTSKERLARTSSSPRPSSRPSSGRSSQSPSLPPSRPPAARRSTSMALLAELSAYRTIRL